MSNNLRLHTEEYKRDESRFVDPKILSDSFRRADWKNIINKENVHLFPNEIVKNISLNANINQLFDMYFLFSSVFIYRIQEERRSFFRTFHTARIKSSLAKIIDAITYKFEDAEKYEENLIDDINRGMLFSDPYSRYQIISIKPRNRTNLIFSKDNFLRFNKAMEKFYYGDADIPIECGTLYPFQTLMDNPMWYKSVEEVNNEFKSIKRKSGYMEKRFHIMKNAMSFGNVNEESAKLISDNLSKGFKKELRTLALDKMDIVRSVAWGKRANHKGISFSDVESFTEHMSYYCYMSVDKFNSLLPIYRTIAFSGLESLDYWDARNLSERIQKEDVPYIMPIISKINGNRYYAKQHIMDKIKSLLVE